MKKVTALFLVLALLLCNLAAVSAAPAEGAELVDVAYVGEEGLVELTIRTETSAAAGKFTLTYDNRTLSLEDVTPAADHASVKTAASAVSCSYVNRPARAGDLAVLRFRYDAEAAKTTKVELKLTVIDQAEKTTELSESLVLELAAKADLCPSSAYTDLDTARWYHEAVDYALQNGFMKGVSETAFDPSGTCTRAMFVTILGRAAGVSQEDYSADELFKDVPAGKWYSAYANWASETGIVRGRSEGYFCPDEPITRQEMVTMLARFAESVGEKPAAANKDVLNSFEDADQIAKYAVEAFAWAVEKGIIKGTGKGIEPAGLATRAQTAQIIYKFLTF
jgi:hypothetical protein